MTRLPLLLTFETPLAKISIYENERWKIFTEFLNEYQHQNGEQNFGQKMKKNQHKNATQKWRFHFVPDFLTHILEKNYFFNRIWIMVLWSYYSYLNVSIFEMFATQVRKRYFKSENQILIIKCIIYSKLWDAYKIKKSTNWLKNEGDTALKKKQLYFVKRSSKFQKQPRGVYFSSVKSNWWGKNENFQETRPSLFFGEKSVRKEWRPRTYYYPFWNLT